MFEGSGFRVETYPYYDAATGGVRFDAMLDALRGLPARSIVLLHACCHNPTGVDLSPAQWDALIPVLRERQLLPYLDLAYQGFGDGIDEDAYAVRALAASGLTFFVANSFSKSMSVYGERCGALSAVCATRAEADLVLGQLRFTVRRIYSSPGIHAAKIVAHVLGDPTCARCGRPSGRDARAHRRDAGGAACPCCRRWCRAATSATSSASAACSATPA
jgi:aromatic-amino-acid transaminase